MSGWSGEVFVFFFSSRRRHTRYWRDWSSDVCSSDLPLPAAGLPVALTISIQAATVPVPIARAAVLSVFAPVLATIPLPSVIVTRAAVPIAVAALATAGVAAIPVAVLIRIATGPATARKAAMATPA